MRQGRPELNLGSVTKDDFMEWRDRVTFGRHARSLRHASTKIEHCAEVIVGAVEAKLVGVA